MTTLSPNYKGFTDSGFEIYLASLSDYNAGTHHGVYIDIKTTTEDEAQELINQMLEDSPTYKLTGVKAEEIAIHDFNISMVDGLEISENSAISTIYEAYSVIQRADSDGYDMQALIDYNNNNNGTIEDLANIDYSDFQDSYQGYYNDQEDFAESILEDTGGLSGIPDNLRGYFDYAKFARDLFMGDYWQSDNGYVFRNI